MGDNFCDFLFPFQHTKGATPKEGIGSYGEKMSIKHYENMPIQIYRKFLQKLKNFR